MYADVLAAGGIRMASLDIWVIVLYFVVIMGVGLWAGLKRKIQTDSKSYFLAGSTLTWAVIGMSLFSTNISTIHLVGFAEEGYVNGLAHGNFEWMAPFLLITLSLFFAPFYLRSRVATLPDFLEHRYCGACRNWLAGLSIVSAVFIHIVFSLYAGAKVFEVLFGIPIWTSIIVSSVLTGIYTIIGGLLAVVITSALQTVILLAGSIIITIAAIIAVGGWGGLCANVDPTKLTILRSSTDPANLPWYSVFLGYPVIGLWYWCADQTIVQRVLGARNENHARVGPLFAGILKVLPVFIFFLPGTIYLALVNKGVFEPLANSKDTCAYAISKFLPVGLVGLMAAALLAALMSTVSGALNSIATLFSYDLYRRWKPDTPDGKLVRIGQAATVVGMVIAILCSPLVEKFPTIYQGSNAVICYLAPPVTAVFAFGVFWRRASSRAALTTLFVGSALGLLVFLCDYYKEYTGWNTVFMMSAFYLFVVCSAVMIIVSLMYPHKHDQRSEKLVWKNVFEALQDKGWRGIGNYKFLAAVLFITMVALYVVFTLPHPRAADNPASVVSGVQCSYFQSKAKNTFGLKDILPQRTDLADNLRPASAGPVSDDTVVKITGYIDIPADGEYTFFVDSNDGFDLLIGTVRMRFYKPMGDRSIGASLKSTGKLVSTLLAGKKPEKVTESAEEQAKKGKIARFLLGKGKHQITAIYYQQSPGKVIRYEGPGVAKAEISSKMLYRQR